MGVNPFWADPFFDDAPCDHCLYPLKREKPFHLVPFAPLGGVDMGDMNQTCPDSLDCGIVCP